MVLTRTLLQDTIEQHLNLVIFLALPLLLLPLALLTRVPDLRHAIIPIGLTTSLHLLPSRLLICIHGAMHRIRRFILIHRLPLLLSLLLTISQRLLAVTDLLPLPTLMIRHFLQPYLPLPIAHLRLRGRLLLKRMSLFTGRAAIGGGFAAGVERGDGVAVVRGCGRAAGACGEVDRGEDEEGEEQPRAQAGAGCWSHRVC